MGLRSVFTRWPTSLVGNVSHFDWLWCDTWQQCEVTHLPSFFTPKLLPQNWTSVVITIHNSLSKHGLLQETSCLSITFFPTISSSDLPSSSCPLDVPKTFQSFPLHLSLSTHLPTCTQPFATFTTLTSCIPFDNMSVGVLFVESCTASAVSLGSIVPLSAQTIDW